MKIINERQTYSCHLKDILYLKSCRRTFLKISIYFIFLSIALLVALIPNVVSNTNDVTLNKRPVRFSTDLKYILFWKQPKKNKKNFFNKDMEYVTGQTEFIKQNCPYINCFITYNRSLLRIEDDFDAIIFNVHDIKKLNAYNVNLGRSLQQIYIFKSFESAEHHPICNVLFEDFFNWTWTYRLDSDISHPFVNIFDNNGNQIGPNNSTKWIKDMTHEEGKYRSRINQKTKAVAWLVTNCKLKNKYKVFIEELREELRGYNYSLDILGPCGAIKCLKGGPTRCLKTIEQEYFFNLVTEDAIAEDYVTEKMARAMSYLSVPIVYGGANYSNFLPPGSYINARDFGLKKLGAVLDYLIRNPLKYEFFFDWKNYYYYSMKPRNYVCDLCAKLNENKIKKSYKELRRWWNPDFDEICQRVRLYDLFNKNL